MNKPKKLIITRYIEGEFAFLSGLADPKFKNFYASYERGICYGQLGFNYYSLSRSSNQDTYFKKIIKKLEYVFSKPGQFNFISYKILFSKIFWQSTVIELHLVYNFMPLLLIKIISHLKKCEWVVHDQSLLTGHCITPFGCGKNLEGCGKCPDLLRVNPIKHDRTHRNLIINKKFISKFKGRFIFTNENFRNKFISQQNLLINQPEVKKILVRESNRIKRISHESMINVGINVAGRFEKNDLLVSKVLKIFGSETKITFQAFGGAPNVWLSKEIKNLKTYGQIQPWDVEQILSMTDYCLNLSTDETLGLMFVEAIMSNSVPILLENGPIIKNYKLDSYVSILEPFELIDIFQNTSREKHNELLLNYKKQIDIFYD